MRSSSRASWPRAFILLALLVQLATARSLRDRDAEDVCFPDDRDGSNLNINAPTCEILGETDFYGLGVRLGIYLSWVSGYIANNFVASEMAGSLDTNSIFLSALTLTVVVSSVWETIWVIDSIILLQLSFGCIFSVMSIWGRRTGFYKQGHFGGWGTHSRLALCTIISAYSLWFWTVQIKNPDPSCFMREQCDGLRTFLFANFSATGGMRVFYAIASALFCVYFGTMVIVATITLGYHLIGKIAGSKKRWIPVEHEAGGCPGMRGSKTLYVVLSGFNLFWIVFSMLMVEFTLNYNHVEGVLASAGITNPGQLLPLLIGLLSLVRICWVLYKEQVIERREKGAKSYGPVELGAFSRRSTAESTGEGSSRTPDAQKPWWYRFVLLWLPWLGTFESYRNYGGQQSTLPYTERAAVASDDAGDYDTVKAAYVSVRPQNESDD